MTTTSTTSNETTKRPVWQTNVFLITATFWVSCDLSRFSTIVTTVQGHVAAGDMAGAKTEVKSLEVARDSAEAGLKPRDPKDWLQLDGQIDTVLTALRAGSPSQAGSAAAPATLGGTLNRFDRV